MGDYLHPHLPLIPPLFLISRFTTTFALITVWVLNGEDATTIIMQRKLFVELLLLLGKEQKWMDVGGFGIIKRELRTAGVGVQCVPSYYFV